MQYSFATNKREIAISSFKRSGIFSVDGYPRVQDEGLFGKWVSREKLEELQDEMNGVYQLDFENHVDEIFFGGTNQVNRSIVFFKQ